MRAPTLEELCDMILVSLRSISDTIVRNAFINCGQTKNCCPEQISHMKEGRELYFILPKLKEIWNEPIEQNTGAFYDNDIEEEGGDELVLEASHEFIDYNEIPDQPTGTDMSEQNDPLQNSNEEEHDKNPHGNTQVTKESEIKICSACDDNSVASYDCKECQDILCDMCFQAHRIVKLTRNHTLTLLRL